MLDYFTPIVDINKPSEWICLDCHQTATKKKGNPCEKKLIVIFAATILPAHILRDEIVSIVTHANSPFMKTRCPQAVWSFETVKIGFYWSNEAWNLKKGDGAFLVVISKWQRSRMNLPRGN
jgi:hypothetical protein